MELQNALAAMGAVLIEGAKWCGKTSTAAHVAQSTLFMQDPDNARSYQQIVNGLTQIDYFQSGSFFQSFIKPYL